MTKLLLGIDAGNYKAKVVGIYGTDTFKTNICDWFERDVAETFGDDDMEFTIGERKGFAGSIAEKEDQFGNGTRYGESKAHEDTKIRVLLAIHRYIEKYNPESTDVYIVTGQPIVAHKESEKEEIIKMLKRKHEYIVNGIDRVINIKDVKVSPEGSAAFFSTPQDGELRILDIGSGTVNMATISGRKHIHKSSSTMDTGMETLKNKNDVESMARGIIQSTIALKWKKNDKVLVCGGAAEPITKVLKKHYENAEVILPQLKRENDIITLKPVYANAVAFYNIAKGVYK